MSCATASRKLWSEINDDDELVVFSPPAASAPSSVARALPRGASHAADDDVNRALFPPTPPKRLAGREVLIRCSIPYKLRSLGGTASAVAAATAGTSPLLNGDSGIIFIAAPSASNTTVAASSSTPIATAADGEGAAAVAAVRVSGGKALLELERVLRKHGGTLAYAELMREAHWRARFQPSHGSLFTFLKRHKAVIEYRHAVVSLADAAADPATPAAAAASPSSASPSPLGAAGASVASEPAAQDGVVQELLLCAAKWTLPAAAVAAA